MYCQHCGSYVYTGNNFCGKCGTKLVRQTLRELRLEEGRAKRAMRELREFYTGYCTGYLRDYCWCQAAKRYHPSESKYTIDTPFIPDSAFEEIKVTQECAIDLFKYLAKCTEIFFKLREATTFRDIM